MSQSVTIGFQDQEKLKLKFQQSSFYSGAAKSSFKSVMYRKNANDKVYSSIDESLVSADRPIFIQTSVNNDYTQQIVTARPDLQGSSLLLTGQQRLMSNANAKEGLTQRAMIGKVA